MGTTSVIPMNIAEIGISLGKTPGSRELLMLIEKEDPIRINNTTYSGSIQIPKGMLLHHPEGLGGT